MTTFNIKEGIKVQREQLAQWKSIMKPVVFIKLQKHCTDLNLDLINGKGVDVWGNPLPMNGYSVFRGTDLDNWIKNYLMKK